MLRQPPIRASARMSAVATPAASPPPAVACGVVQVGGELGLVLTLDGVTLGVLPLGTGNDFARSLGIPPHDLDAACKVIHAGHVTQVDLGRCNERFFLNAAPARGPGTPKADVTIVNRLELDALPHQDGLIVVTHGAEGAVLLEDGVEVARAVPPAVTAIDGTAAGDAFTACLVVSLLEGRKREEAFRRACIAGALAASKLGAQTSLPTAEEVDALL
jgi:ribokinase